MAYKVGELGVGSILGEEEVQAVARVLESGNTLAYGPCRDKFEKEFAEYCGVGFAVSATSATTALQMACQILHMKEGDEIVGTPQTFRATYVYLGDRGVSIRFADIDRETLNIDPATIEDKITPRTKALYIMDYGGNPVDMDPVMEIARKHNLAVIEDAAHSPGAEYKGRKIGSIADITCFSFHSLKNMTTLGEGGMLTTHNPVYAERARKLRTMDTVGERKERDSRQIGPYKGYDRPINDHSGVAFTHEWMQIDEWGSNFRMSEVQAAVGSVQLKKLDAMNDARARVAARYSEGLSKIEGIRLSRVAPDVRNVWHLYPCFMDSSVIKAGHEEFINYLDDKGIQIIQRFFPVHLSDYMRYLGHQFGECPVCEKVWFEEQLNLPINPKMSFDQVDYVVESIREAVNHFKR